MVRVLVKNASNPNPRNLLINGGFDFWQRGLGPVSASTTPGYITADRWMFELDGSGSFSPSANSTTPDDKFRFSLHCAHATATNSGHIWQRIEASDIAPYIDKTLTFSLWLQVYGGTFSGFNMAAYVPPSGRDVWPAENTSGILIADSGNLVYPTDSVWKRVSFSFTVPSTAKNGMVVLFKSSSSTAAAAYRVAGAMLTEGPAAPDVFYTAGDNIADELALCQRYYEKSYDILVAPGTASSAPGVIQAGTIAEASNAYYNIPFKVSKRNAPVMTGYNYSAGTIDSFVRFVNGGGSTIFTPGFGNLGNNAVTLATSGVAAGDRVAFLGHWTADAEL